MEMNGGNGGNGGMREWEMEIVKGDK